MEKKSERIATAVEVRCRWDIWQARWDQEVLKLKERNQNKSSSFGHQRNTF